MRNASACDKGSFVLIIMRRDEGQGRRIDCWLLDEESKNISTSIHGFRWVLMVRERYRVDVDCGMCSVPFLYI